MRLLILLNGAVLRLSLNKCIYERLPDAESYTGCSMGIKDYEFPRFLDEI